MTIMEIIKHKHDVVEIKGFLTEQECLDMIDYLESSEEDWMEICFYGNMGMDVSAPARKNHNKINMAYIEQLRSRMQWESEKVFDRPLKNNAISAHKWTTGSFAEPHADNAELDGTPNSWQQNKIVAIVYFNDNYDGGELYFPQHDIEVKIDAGTLMIFDVGIENLHGVKTVTSGNRYSMLTSWDYAENTYPEGFQEQKLADEAKALEDAYKKREVIKQMLAEGKDISQGQYFDLID